MSYGIAFSIVAAVVGLSAFAILQPVLKARPRVAECGSDTMAFVMSQTFVKKQLKAPSTAKFPYINEASVLREGKCGFRVESYVDAQNSFGAMLRTYYTASVVYEPRSDTWRGLAVMVE